MRPLFLIPLVIVVSLFGQLLFAGPFQFVAFSKKEETHLKQIDKQIHDLEDAKRGFESRAAYHEDQASRLQFDDQTYLEMRRHTQLAEENKAKAAAAQKEIDRLEAEKNKIIN